MKSGNYVNAGTALAIAVSCMALSSIGGADSVAEKRRQNVADQELFFAPVPKAVCGPGDRPESALQGQVTAAQRAAGFQGASCNLQLLGQVKGEGANWQTTEWREGRGKSKKVCAYHGTAAPTANPGMARTNFGVRAIDISDPAWPVNTAYLQTSAMLDPWESLKINERRELLGAVNGSNGNLAGSSNPGASDIDIYDVSGDCRYPQLLSSRSVGTDPSIELGASVIGHEGSWAPDGLTYYGSGGAGYYAVDTIDTTKPKLLAVWRNPTDVGGGHGLSVSEDGTRGYFIAAGNFGVTFVDPAVAPTNGVVIYDLSDVQSRRTNPQVRVVNKITWRDGSIGQHTIPVTIGRKPYLIAVDEGGTAGLGGAAFAAACAAQLTLFPLARIIDLTDELNPRTVSKLMLETHDPANCDKLLPDIAGLGGFVYGAHYCSVDNRNRATTLACGYQNSGLRVFDIRDPIRPREIAYYNPPATSVVAGSNHAATRVTQPGGPDWCSAQVHLDAEAGTLWSTCQDNGLLSLKFTHNAWPFAETRTPPGMQN